MQRWFWMSIVGLSLMAAFAIDRIVWPDHVVVWLYGVPILVASTRWLPLTVLGVFIVCLVLAIADLLASGGVTTQGALELATLAIVGTVGMHHTYHRQALLRKLQRQQVVIDTVQRLRQPLTIILGYCQLLETSHPSAITLANSLNSIQRAGIDLRDQLNEIVALWGRS